jgi:FSR family fosmidomycin resistance protein-like MFS transporter
MESAENKRPRWWPRRDVPLQRNGMLVPVQLGLMHALVDAAPAALLYGALARGQSSWEQICYLILLYNCLAFGLQLPLGWLADSLRSYNSVAGAGLLATMIALGLSGWPQVAVVIVAVGNALFHIGAGALVLQRCNGRAMGLGIFVAPGAAGVLLGVWLGGAGFPAHLALMLALMASALLLFVRRIPSLPMGTLNAGNSRSAVLAGVSMLAVVVAVRSLVGGAVAGGWWGLWVISLFLALAALAGKVLGGVIADHLGWRVCTVGALLLLVPITHAALTSAPVAAAAAIFLIQMTMPVTLAAAFSCFPARPATVFGFFSGVLLLGAIPGLTGFASRHNLMRMPAALVSLTALVLLVGLSLCGRAPAAAKQLKMDC